MRSPRLLTPVLVLALAPALAACGGDGGEPEDSPPASSTPDPVEESTDAATDATTGATASDAGGELPDACDAVTSDDVAAAYGVPFGAAEPGGGGHTEGDLGWQSDNCDWEAEDLVEVQLALTGPADFTGGEFTCPEPTSIASTVERVPGLGDSAYWELDDAPPLEATLRVCTASYNFDIDVEYEDGVDFEGDPKQQSIALAGVVLAKVG